MRQELIELIELIEFFMFFMFLCPYFFKKLEKIKLFLLTQFVMALNYLKNFENFVVELEDLQIEFIVLVFIIDVENRQVFLIALRLIIKQKNLHVMATV
jgi:hypothetical protein